jgi:Synergist-CTERM protein sorting domain-containing protein
VYPENATNKKVTWATSNSIVATVNNNGVVEGGAVGKAVITATTENGGFKATCNVTVVKDASTEEIALDPKELTLEVGETKTIGASFSDEWGWADVEWRTEESNIAKIEPLLAVCYVTGVSAGTTSIVATLGDASADCKVTVTGATPAVPTTPTTSDDITVPAPTNPDDPVSTTPDDSTPTTPGGSTPTTPTTPTTPGTTPETSSNSGGGGCNAGILPFALLVLVFVVRRHK